ncbi:hypothetical protein FOA52_001743 [Chlamydomonas sp. UWO 241]|nr:hypothetical protein FOA52_001743 [Chlamydomonas sp. UWO 241]
MFEFLNEAKSIIDIDLSQRSGLELQYAEYGLGGGDGDDGSQPARSLKKATSQPFWGIYGPYKKSSDPWSRSDMLALNRRFWATSLDWLASGTGPTYDITACYAWSLASWDVLGIYPESTTSEGSYRDEVIASQVTEHNRRAREVTGV